MNLNQIRYKNMSIYNNDYLRIKLNKSIVRKREKYLENNKEMLRNASFVNFYDRRKR